MTAMMRRRASAGRAEVVYRGYLAAKKYIQNSEVQHTCTVCPRWTRSSSSSCWLPPKKLHACRAMFLSSVATRRGCHRNVSFLRDGRASQRGGQDFSPKEKASELLSKHRSPRYCWQQERHLEPDPVMLIWCAKPYALAYTPSTRLTLPLMLHCLPLSCAHAAWGLSDCLHGPELV